MRNKDLHAIVGKKLYKDAVRAVKKFHDDADKKDPYGYEFVDTERFAIEGRTDQIAQYERIADGGCCGSYDGKLQLNEDTVLLYGFNYGH